MRAYTLVIAFAAMVAAAGCGDGGSAKPDPGVCGDGVVDSGEDCDNGSANAAGGPCTLSCKFACTTDNDCSDSNACTGTETCSNHVCKTGTAPAEGSSCGTGMVCHSNTCTSIKCGDGKMDTGEECDDGAKNGTAGDACNATCHFTCKVDTDCSNNNACDGAEVCTNHVCGAGTAPAEGSSCGTGKFCHAAACVDATCGDGLKEGSEECDLGTADNGTGKGCRADCAFECGPTHPDSECAGTAAACQKFACSEIHTCVSATDSAKEATTCDANSPPSVCISGSCTAPAVCEKFVCEGLNCALEPDLSQNNADCDSTNPDRYCANGACLTAACGNTIVDRGEQCDHGSNNGATGDSCAANCQFTCIVDTDCGDGNACNGTETCSNNACVAGTPLDDGASCSSNPNDFCRARACVSPVCGNQVREPGEQCDDGNKLNLDGCDSACQFEAAARVISLQQRWDRTTFCPNNAFGDAITPAAQTDVIQPTWDIPVQDGTQSIVFKFLGLTDLAGQNGTFKLGFVNARAGGRSLVTTPVCGNHVCEQGAGPGTSETILSCPQDCIYNGNSDLDWWYIRDPASVDANETPLVQLPGQVTAGHLTAGPGTISLNLLFAFEPAQITLHNTVIDSTLDPVLSKPLISSTGLPPGHLASENLSPTLTTFSTSSTGSMCSLVSLGSLFSVRLPALLQTLCTTEDGSTPMYTSDNKLLDVFVGGCLLFGTPAIVPTQPDGSTDGATYKFAIDAITRTVTSCTRNDAPAVLADCLSAATYSSYFDFVSDRVIIKRN